MTTMVKILIEGNKACEVQVVGPSTKEEASVVQPGTFISKMIHGEMQVVVKEVGDFVN